MDFTANEGAVLNRLQKGIPGVSEPFRKISEETGISEDEVISIVKNLKEKNIIRNISGIFEGKKLGYHLSLVAFEVPEEKVESAAAVINSHPGVSHNYLRNHKFNIWFTLAEESAADFEKTVTVLAAKSGASDHLVLRNEKLLKIGVFLDMSGEGGETETGNSGKTEESSPVEISDETGEAVLLLQNDLPVEKHPFRKLAESGKLISDESTLLHYYSEFLEQGIMRRYAAVLRHNKAGYSANAMTAWKAEGGEDISAFLNEKAISHLYFRTIHPGRWEHPLFAMIHAKRQDELENIIDGLSRKSGIKDYLSLSSLKEFKKKRVRYFSEEFSEWKRLNYD